MSYQKLKAFTFSCLTLFFISACNPLTVQPNHAESDLNSQDNILNLLDPEVKTEKQAFAKAEEALSQGKNDNALFYYIKVLQYNKQNIKALEQIANIHNRTNHPELALKVYKDILAIDNQNLLANENLGLYFLENGQAGKAKEYLTVAVKSNNTNWKAHNALGVIADLEHNSKDAIAHYEAALAVEPSNPMLLNNLGYSYYLTGDLHNAKYFFTQALNYDNKYKRAIHNLALIEIKNGNLTTAVALFNRIMPAHESYNNIGYISMLNGQYDIAEEYLRRAIDESPVYFPKAQENLKTLMALKAKTQSFEPSVSTPPITQPSVSTRPAPLPNQGISAKAAQTKPAIIVKAPVKKTVSNRPAAFKKKQQ